MTTTAAAIENDEGRPNGTALDQQHHDPATPDGDHDQDTSTGDDRPEVARWSAERHQLLQAEGPTDATRFRDWFIQQQDHADPLVRDVARDASEDKTWPEEAVNLDDLRDYFIRQGAVSEALDGLERAWSLWSSLPDSDPFADLVKVADPAQDDDEHQDQTPTLDLDQVRAWIELAYPPAMLDGVLHVSATDAWTGRRFRRAKLDALLDYVAQLDRDGRAGIYLRAATMDPKAGKGRGKAADSVELVGLWSDLDIAGPGHKHDPAKHDGLTLPPGEAAARAIVERAGLPTPSVWIHSGGGLYAWWLLDFPEDLTDPEERKDAGRIVAQLQDLLALAAKQAGHHYGTGVKDLARVLRIPGTVNRKDGLARPCRIVDQTGDRYRLDDLAEVIERELARFKADRKETPKATAPTPAKDQDDDLPFTMAGHGSGGPGDDFEARVDWSEILEPHGWTFSHEDPDGTRYWIRPGKDKDEGHSASTGHAEDRDRMYVWSDAAGLPVQESMTKFYVWAILNGHGNPPDMKAAAAQLRADGYGKQDQGDGRTFTEKEAIAYISEHAIGPLKDPDADLDQLRASAVVCGRFIGGGFGTEEDATRRLVDLTGQDTDGVRETIAEGIEEGKADPFIVEGYGTARRSRRVDLRPYLDGTHKPPEPGIGAERSDGIRLLYPAKWHTVIGLTGCGKSWLACWHAAAELEQGNTVVYLHFEEAGPAPTMERFRALGLDDDVIADRLVWLETTVEPWEPDDFAEELAALDPAPTLVILDGIAAACDLHAWPIFDTEGVGAYRRTLVAPATHVEAAVLSLGHPPKARDRQGERHGYGATGWLDLVDGVGFRMEAAKAPVQRGTRGHAYLYAVKDRAGGVTRHGIINGKREAGWWELGTFTVDDTVPSVFAMKDGEHQLLDQTAVDLRAPAAITETADATDRDEIDDLADAIVEHLAKTGGRYESANKLRDSLRAAKVPHSNDDIGPALDRLDTDGRIMREPERRGRPRAGWLPDHFADQVKELEQRPEIEGGPDQ
jgi:hypothetical protein